MTPLFKKLNLGTSDRILVLNPPEPFELEIARLTNIKILRKCSAKPTIGFAIGFAVTRSELDDLSQQLSQSTQGDAVVWVAYPQRTSKKYRCEFNRDSGWSVLGNAGCEPVRQIRHR